MGIDLELFTERRSAGTVALAVNPVAGTILAALVGPGHNVTAILETGDRRIPLLSLHMGIRPNFRTVCRRYCQLGTVAKLQAFDTAQRIRTFVAVTGVRVNDLAVHQINIVVGRIQQDVTSLPSPPTSWSSPAPPANWSLPSPPISWSSPASP